MSDGWGGETVAGRLRLLGSCEEGLSDSWRTRLVGP